MIPSRGGRSGPRKCSGSGQSLIEGKAGQSGRMSPTGPCVLRWWTRSLHKGADLLGGPPDVGVRGHAKQVHRPAGHLQNEEHVDSLERHRAVHVEEVAGSIVDAWARRNCRQVVSVSRIGAGGIPHRCRMRRIVEAPRGGRA
jgi:hypothetical protein